MMRYRITVHGKTYDVEVLSDPRRAQVEVRVDGELLTAQVEAASPTPAQSRVAPQTASQPVDGQSRERDTQLRSPLPGLITSVAVRPGQRVARGDVVLTIEAMKMNNLIKAGRSGTIAAVHAVEGRQVAHGDLLLEWETDQ